MKIGLVALAVVATVWAKDERFGNSTPNPSAPQKIPATPDFFKGKTKECSQLKTQNELFKQRPQLSGRNFAGAYRQKFKYSKSKMIPAETQISNIIDDDGNFLVFRVIRAPFDPKGVVTVKEGVSYSLSPSIAKHWGDHMLDRTGGKRYWLLIGENNLSQNIHPGQARNEHLRLSKDSRVVTPNTDEVGLNEIKIEPDEQNIVAAVSGEELSCLYSQLSGEFTAAELIRLLTHD